MTANINSTPDAGNLDMAASPKKADTRRRKLAVLLLLTLIICLLAGGYVLFLHEEALRPPPPAARKQPDTSSPPQPGKDAGASRPTQREGAAATTAIQPVEQTPAGGIAMPKVNDSVRIVTDLGSMNELQSMRETLRIVKETRTLEKDIAALNKQIKDIQTEPLIVAMPHILPSTAPEPEKVPVNTKSSAPVPTTIISIQGVNNALAAHVRHDNGEITVIRKGQSFAGGVVESISRDGITLMKNGRRVFIAYGD